MCVVDRGKKSEMSKKGDCLRGAFSVHFKVHGSQQMVTPFKHIFV